MDNINDSSSSSSFDQAFQDFIIFLDVWKYNERFLEKMPQRTSSLMAKFNNGIVKWE